MSRIARIIFFTGSTGLRLLRRSRCSLLAMTVGGCGFSAIDDAEFLVGFGGGRGIPMEGELFLGGLPDERFEPVEAEVVGAGFPVAFLLAGPAKEVPTLMAGDPDEGLIGGGDGHVAPDVLVTSGGAGVGL